MELRACDNEAYFITLTVIDWIDVFTRREYMDFIVENLNYCRTEKGLEIYAFVIMSNHIHLIVRSKIEPLGNILRDFKTYTSKELFKMIDKNTRESRRDWMINAFKNAAFNNPLNKFHQFWQNDNQPILINNHETFLTKQNYIHQNPVRAGLVVNDFEYVYSSASENCPLTIDPFS
ncbi:MAG: transposase [Bacteroidales bacterium]|nr:transposase [Bacteroidales bacterium]HOY38593.1 transposase [Bacteroidales bacterium]HQP04493.1 transposase [Bacteroidales bacterium]